MAAAEDFMEDFEDESGVAGILDMLNFKIVPKDPEDPNYNNLNDFIPLQSRMYAAEYFRLQDNYNRLKEKMTAELAAKNEVMMKERELGDKALEMEQKLREEAREALKVAQREAVESKKSFLMEQKNAEKANEALATMQKEAEEAKKSLLEEQEKVENLREEQEKMLEQLNEGVKKSQEQKEKQEKLEQLVSSVEKKLEEAQLKITKKEKEVEHNGQFIQDLQKQNEELKETSTRDKVNLNQIQKEKEKLEEDLGKLTATNSQLQEKLSKAEGTSCELQINLDALQEKFTEAEDKLKEEIVKCGEFKTTLEKATENLKKKDDELTNVVAQLGVRQTDFETVEQINHGLKKQISDLQTKLKDKASEIGIIHRDLIIESEAKEKLETKFIACRESLHSFNLELTQLLDKLKSTTDFVDKGEGPNYNALQSQFESLFVSVQSKLESTEDNQKELQAGLAQTKQIILSIIDYIRKQSRDAERLTMPPPPPPPPKTLIPLAASYGLSDQQVSMGTVQMSKKIAQMRATRTSVKSFFTNFFTKQKLKKRLSKIMSKKNKMENMAIPIPKVKIKQRKTRRGEYLYIVPPSPAHSTMRNDEENISQNNESILMDEGFPPPSPKPLDQNIKNDDRIPSSSSNQNIEAESESPQPLAPLGEIGNTTTSAVTCQQKEHRIDETKTGHYCLCGKDCKTKTKLQSHIHYHSLDNKFPCAICGHRFKQPSNLRTHYLRKHKQVMKKPCGRKFYSKKQLGRHQTTTHASIQPKHATGESGDHGKNGCIQIEMGCSACGEKAFATVKELTIHKMAAHSTRNHSTGMSEGTAGNQTDSLEPQPSTSKGPPVQINDQVSLKSGRTKIRPKVIRKNYRSKTTVPPTNTQSNKPGLSVPKQPLLPSSPTTILTPATIKQVENESFKESGEITTPGDLPYSHSQRPSSSSYSAEAAKSDDDVIIDSHLTYERCLPQVKHEIDQEMLSNGHFLYLCEQNFGNLDDLNSHLKQYSSHGKFICKNCGQSFLLATCLRRHMLRVHKIILHIPYGCKHCGKTFSTNLELYEHSKIKHNSGHPWEQRHKPSRPKIHNRFLRK